MRAPLDRWMLPGELARAARPGSRGRTARDWVVDTALFASAVAVGLAEYSTTVTQNAYGLPDWLRVVDPVLGGLLCLSLWWRRRHPLPLGIAAAVVSAGSNTATGAVLVLLFSLAVHRGWRPALAVVALALLLGVPYVLTYFPNVGDDPLTSALVITLLVALVATSGLAVRARRQLVLVLRRQAHEQAAHARRDERARIAREMHDVLAHRISLLTVHAGALEYRTARAAEGGPPLTPAEVAASVAVMRDGAHRALEELREVLDVLRRPDLSDDGTAPPPPAADRLPELLADARRGGQQVDAVVDGDLTALRDPVQRTVFRTVQEGLTNARKHAPGAPVTLLVRAADDDVVVEVGNPVTGRGSGLPGAGTGLAGLTERVALHGGTLTGAAHDGRFRLRARIPADRDAASR